MALPQLTDEQRKQALEKAAAARHARAELREQIKKGEKSLESVLNSDDPIASRMKVSTLIESLPGYGKAKAAKIMEELGISATRRVQGLGVRQPGGAEAVGSSSGSGGRTRPRMARQTSSWARTSAATTP